MSSELKAFERRVVEWLVRAWCGALVAVPLVAAFIAYIDVDLNDYWWLPLLVLGLPSGGLLLVALGVLSHDRKAWFQLGDTDKEQERQLKHIRSLAGLQALIGAGTITTIIAAFGDGALEQHLILSSVVWLVFAIVYFVAYWGSSRIEAR